MSDKSVQELLDFAKEAFDNLEFEKAHDAYQEALEILKKESGALH